MGEKYKIMITDQEWKLIISILCDEATEEEKQSFRQWLACDPSHQDLYEEVRQIYAAGKALSPETVNWETEKSWEETAKRIRNTSRPRGLKLKYVLSYAAVLLLLLAAGSWLWFQSRRDTVESPPSKAILVLDDGQEIKLGDKDLQISQNSIQVKNVAHEGLTYEQVASPPLKASRNRLIIPKGGDYQITLSDGTRVWLNSESELSYPTFFDSDKREVTLRGEAYFEVSKDSLKPFYVKTDLLFVRVYGTSFNVTSYPDEKTVKTTLVEGSVSVIRNGGEQLLQPSEQHIYNKVSEQSEIKEVDVNYYTQWRTGKYYFNNLELAEIMTQIRRWYDVEVQYEQEAYQHYRFSGVIYKPNRLEYSLGIIEKATDLKFKMKGNTIYVIK